MNSPEKLLILSFILIFCSHIESFPVNRNQCDQSKVSVKPSAESQKILIGYYERNRRGNPEERGPYFEGDIIRPRFKMSQKPPQIWKNGTVPYQIAPSFSKFNLIFTCEFRFNSILQLQPKRKL